MIELFDRNFKKIAILQNAFNISEELKINSINYFSFSLPENDLKNELCKPFNYIRYNNGELYRIMNTINDISEQGIYHYKCEHAIALLMDKLMFSLNPIVVGNRGYYTKDVIAYVLNQQPIKNWVIDECDFSRQFEYGWEQENLLSALFSIPNSFTESYMWVFDTKVYPFKLSLKRISLDINPQMYIRFKKNAIKLLKTSDPQRICTRIYPLGAGEGINQLTIKEVNNGLPFLQSPSEYIDKYGIIERAWIDRRYTNPESLRDSALSMLNELQEPYMEYQVEYAALGNDYFDSAEVGKVVSVVGHTKSIITGISKNYDEVERSTITIANRPKDIASTVAELADRQRIEMTYSQGATQIFQVSQPGTNADTVNGAPLSFYIPSDMLIINKVVCKVDVSPFRAYSKATSGGGGQTISQSNTNSSGASSITTTLDGGGATSGSSSLNTTYDGGGSTSGSSSLITTDSSGYISRSTLSGGGATSGSSSTGTSGFSGSGEIPSTSNSTSWSGNNPNGTNGDLAIGRVMDGEGVGSHIHAFNPYHSHRLKDHSHGMQHVHEIYSHTHNFTIDAHYHGMAHTHYIYAHGHRMEHTHYISNHSHGISHLHDIKHNHQIPDHVHEITPGIYFFGNPSSFDIFINGEFKQHIDTITTEVDITNMLLNDEKIIPRGQFHKIEIIPNDLAYVSINLSVQGFIQSRGDMTV